MKPMGQCQLETVDMSLIRENKLLSVSIREQDVKRCVQGIGQYGMMTPLVIRRHQEGSHTVLSGGCELQALREINARSTDAVVVENLDDTQATKLLLHLISLKQDPEAVVEGLVARELLKDGKLAQADVAVMVGKSVSWVSKRLSLISRLNDTVIQMVVERKLSARTAVEISKLAPDVQNDFAIKVIAEKLPKSAVEMLVTIYNRPNTAESLRKHMLSSPKDALSRVGACLERRKKEPKTAEIAGDRTRTRLKFQSCMRLLIEVIEETEVLYAALLSDELRRFDNTLATAKERLSRLLTLLKIGYVGKNTPFAPGQMETNGTAPNTRISTIQDGGDEIAYRL